METVALNLPLFIFLLVTLTLASLWIGKKATKEIVTQEDYFLGGRSLGVFALAMTLLATQLGGGALMGAAEEAYLRGWGVLFYPLGMVIGLAIMGLGFGARIRSFNLTTVAELFEKRYGSPFLRKVAAALSIFSLYLILVGQAIAAKKFFGSLGFTEVPFCLFWGALILYTTMGGLKAVVNTDMLQASFILGVFLLVFLSGINFPETIPTQLPVEAVSKSSGLPWMTWLLMPLLFMLIEQDMGQRCFAARRPRTVSLASFLAAALLLISCVCPIFFGVMAQKYQLSIPEGSSVLLTATYALTNPSIATFMVCAVLMAILSTADSLLNSIGSNLACDFPAFKQKSLNFSRCLTAIVGLSTIVLAFLFDNVVSVLMFSYELSVSVLCVPILVGIWKKEPRRASAVFSMVFGALGLFFFHSLPFKELLTIGTSLVGFYLPLLVKRKAVDIIH